MHTKPLLKLQIPWKYFLDNEVVKWISIPQFYVFDGEIEIYDMSEQ